jgi:hypothetical protein
MQGELSKKDKMIAFLLGIVVGLVILAIALYQVPAIQDRLSWRIDFAMAFARGLIDPVRPMPTPVEATLVEAVGLGGADPLVDEPTLTPIQTQAVATLTPTNVETTAPVGTPVPTATLVPTLTPTQIPEKVVLPAPAYEKQEVNNCGPTTLAMNLRFYGWQGNQATISDLIKPKREDRNVNVEELVGYVNTQVPGLEVQYRVGGTIDTLRRLVAAGFPVTIEEAFIMAESYWYQDDRWAGHYLLITGYDDAKQKFITQDVFLGPNVGISYNVVEKNWSAFNHVYLLVYPSDQRQKLQEVLGDQWDANINRQYALDQAQKETEANPTDSYAWFNMGTNLVYFERYGQAAKAYDEARKIGLPQRMLRYQFGPFFAYFHTNRIDDLLALTEYALKRTPNSEEALLWRGWAMYRKSDREEALKLFQQALDARPDNPDAEYAIGFVRSN